VRIVVLSMSSTEPRNMGSEQITICVLESISKINTLISNHYLDQLGKYQYIVVSLSKLGSCMHNMTCTK